MKYLVLFLLSQSASALDRQNVADITAVVIRSIQTYPPTKVQIKELLSHSDPLYEEIAKINFNYLLANNAFWMDNGWSSETERNTHLGGVNNEHTRIKSKP